MPQYKVWIGLERIDSDEEDPVELDLPFAAAATVSDETKARRLAGMLHRLGSVLVEDV